MKIRLKKLDVMVFAILLFFAVNYSVKAQSDETQADKVKSDEIQSEKVQTDDTESTQTQIPKTQTPKTEVGDLSSKDFAISAGIGGMVSPGAFSGKISGEYLFDGIFSMGPYIQGAVNSDIRIFMVLLDGKFRVPIQGIDPRFKFNAIIGAGYLYKNRLIGNDHDFTGHAGIGGEYFILNYLSVGLDVIANITSATSDRFFMSILAGVNYFI